MHNGFVMWVQDMLLYAQKTIYSAGTMLSLYVTSNRDLCQEKSKTETWDEDEGFPQVVYMQVKGWKDVFTPRKKPDEKSRFKRESIRIHQKPVFTGMKAHTDQE